MSLKNMNTLFKAYQILNKHLGAKNQTVSNSAPIEPDFVPFAEETTSLWDEIYEIKILSEKMQDIIEGKDDGPMLTPVKPKRRKIKEEESDEEGRLSVFLIFQLGTCKRFSEPNQI